jgi:1,4-alpha-glucan branching enzyme
MPEQTGTAPSEVGPVRHDRPLLTDHDLYLFSEGTQMRAHEKLGAHLEAAGTHFACWAPNADRVDVVGSFNQWAPGAHPLKQLGGSGVWQGFIPGVKKGDLYKFHIASRIGGYKVDKADPYGILHQCPPRTASVVWELGYDWNDEAWMKARAKVNSLTAPVSVYEVHLGSWMRKPEENFRSLTYREIAPLLVEYLKRTAFTHVEFLPVMEHPFFGSWGYQTTGYFAPSARQGEPQDFMYLVDRLHQAGYGVILDWVPSHFPTDEHGLVFFDGTHVYEHADRRQGHQPDWNSSVFNYGRHEVRSFLLSSAHQWLKTFHADGLRVDAVASMLYLDYSRKEGEWIPNAYGGRENIEAIDFMRLLNESVRREFPDVLMIAEESTAWPMVTRPAPVGGLGFHMKWDMGWMHDTLAYYQRDPVFRKFHHDKVTFRMLYAFSESFMLPLSHDEVVHGKGSLINKMPGDTWQKFANLRLLLSSQFAQPAKKLLFMGGELGQFREWNHDGSIDWHLLNDPLHSGLVHLVQDLNLLYRAEPSLHELDCDPAGFEWIDCNDSDQGVVSMMRKSKAGQLTVVVLNFTPIPRTGYRVGVPLPGAWLERVNSDSATYGGANWGNAGRVHATGDHTHGRAHTLWLTVPPLGAIFLTPEKQPDPPPKREKEKGKEKAP